MQGSEVLSALHHAWRTLTDLGAPAAVMGGIAVSTWHHIRATRDVDLLVGVEQFSIDDIFRAFQQAACRPKRFPNILEIGGVRILQLTYQPPGSYLGMSIDLMFAESEFHRSALSRRIQVSAPGISESVSFVACEDLILFKLLADRILDRSDAINLLQANRPEIDWTYLRHWSERLNVTQDLQNAWNEAFPGETLPTASSSSSENGVS